MIEQLALGESKAFVIAAARKAAGTGDRPWVWYAPTLAGRHPGDEEQWMFDAFQAKGISIAGVDAGESYGSPTGRAVFGRLYEHMIEQGYCGRPVLLARSRGGLMLYNWAAEHAACVAGIAGIYPVCNLASYPGLAKAAPAYDMSETALTRQLPEHNPIDRLEPLAKAGVPIFHIHGDRDAIVPCEQNTSLLAQRYRALGGVIHIEVVPGGGHDLSRSWFESRTLTDFVIDCALGGVPSGHG